ncbi:MAG: MFS transporter [Hyphomonadaceae bacterium]|nr:MFS transporter [Hyphomonadaceae bacterium]
MNDAAPAISVSANAAPAMRPSHGRFFILGLIAVGTMINYLDRSVLSVAAPQVSADLNLTPAIMGIVFSAFSWTYAAAQIPGGIVLDRIGTRITYFFSVSLWSIFTALQGLTAGFYSLLACRLGLGVAEAPCFPANSRVLGVWFPQHERARANAVYSVGQYFGLAFLSPLLYWVTAEFGWRALFIGAGLAGLAFAGIWLMAYREPGRSRIANQAELDYIAQGGGIAVTSAAADVEKPKLSWSLGMRLLGKRQILGASIGQFAGNSTLVFFLTWFPTYLATERGMEWIKVGFYAVLPFIAASVGVIVGGLASDIILRRTGSANVARKLPIIAGLFLAATIIGANFADSDVVVIAILSVAFFGQGMVNLGWTLISDIAPVKYVGLTGGIFNLCANLAGIITPIVVGFIVAGTGSFFFALAYIGALALLGAFAYIFVVGDVKRVEIE